MPTGVKRGRMCMKNLNGTKEIFKKGILITALAVIAAILATMPMACTTEEQPNTIDGPEKPGKDDQNVYKAVKPLTLPRIHKDMTQEEIDAAIINVLDQVIEQTIIIEENYTKWNGSSLAYDVAATQRSIRASAQDEGGHLGYTVSVYMESSFDYLFNEKISPQVPDRSLFNCRFKTLFNAHVMEQLQKYGDEVSVSRETFNNNRESLAQRGGEIIDTPEQAIRELPPKIREQMPDRLGPKEIREGILEQNQALGKLEGFATDLRLTFGWDRDLSIPTRAKTQDSVK